MNIHGKEGYPWWMVRVGVATLALCGQLAVAQRTGGHQGSSAAGGTHAAAGAHQHIDGRFSHNQSYFDHGYSVHRPPSGSVGDIRGRDGGRYRFHGGNWYRWGGGAWVVWGAPFGVFVPFLPPYFTTVWWSGIPYYYANDSYYLWDDTQHQYQVVAPPDGIESAVAAPAPSSDQLFAYPKNGQSTDQQAKDRQDCERWAVDQTRFEPNADAAGAADAQTAQKHSDFIRAQMTCLEGRGYAVR